jgi:hypothetical protein
MSAEGPPRYTLASGGEAAGPKGASASQSGGRLQAKSLNNDSAEAANSAPSMGSGAHT